MKNKYETHIAPHLEKIADLVGQGYSDKKIAESLGISYSTFRVYIKKHSALSAVLKKEKGARNVTVENSLYKKATGFYVTVVKHIKCKQTEYDPLTGKKVRDYEKLVAVEEQEYIPPDTGANIFWCVNHMGDKYKNNPHKLNLDERRVKLAEEKAKEEW